MKEFVRGFFVGVALCAATAALVWVFGFFHRRDKKIIERMEVQNELRLLQEDYGNRDGDYFLDGNDAVRRAADAGIERFGRKRDEVLQRIRGNSID
jgi:hypothetical protein